MEKSEIKYCECGCGQKTLQNKRNKTYNRYIHGHTNKGIHLTQKHKFKISLANKNKIITEKTKQKISKTLTGHKVPIKIRQKISRTMSGRKLSEEHKINVSISLMKKRIDGYCHIWGDKEYKQDLRKNYCEICKIKEIKIINKDGILRSNLGLHHVDFNKKNCHPDNIQTTCKSCHMKTHQAERNDYFLKLQKKQKHKRGLL